MHYQSIKFIALCKEIHLCWWREKKLLPSLTDFSKLFNVGEINIFTTKLNLESKLSLALHFHLENKIRWSTPASDYF